MPARKAERLFVYGTLRRGGSNHALLRGARYLGDLATPPLFRLYDFGDWPGAMQGGELSIKGEVYSISPRILGRVDLLEDYPRLYTRQPIDTPWGPAWVYLLQRRPLRARVLANGDWLAHSRTP